MDEPATPLLFLVADTGGGHRAAARAVGQALDAAYPGMFAPVLCDPFGGAGAPALLRRVTGLYGPLIRHFPLLWGLIFYDSDSSFATKFLRATVFRASARPVIEAVARHEPAVIASFHPLLGGAAVKGGHQRSIPVVTVITDLITAHTAWRYDKVDLIIAPSAQVRSRCLRDGLAAARCVEIGLPVATDFIEGPPRPDQRATLRNALAVDEQRFVIVLAGGGEGAGGIAGRAAAILRRFDDVQVVALCGRNRRLARRLGRLATGAGGRLIVKGFVANMADWLHCADLLVTKAGPGTIAEATCCGTPLLFTCHTPGQEKGNAEYVIAAGAGRRARGIRSLLREIDRLRRDPAELEAMRTASAGLARPNAATEIAAHLARLAATATAHRTASDPTPQEAFR